MRATTNASSIVVGMVVVKECTKKEIDRLNKGKEDDKICEAFNAESLPRDTAGNLYPTLTINKNSKSTPV